MGMGGHSHYGNYLTLYPPFRWACSIVPTWAHLPSPNILGWRRSTDAPRPATSSKMSINHWGGEEEEEEEEEEGGASGGHRSSKLYVHFPPHFTHLTPQEGEEGCPSGIGLASDSLGRETDGGVKGGGEGSRGGEGGALGRVHQPLCGRGGHSNQDPRLTQTPLFSS